MEQQKMSDALSHKQRVIEQQGHQIAELDRANARLRALLASLRDKCNPAVTAIGALPTNDSSVLPTSATSATSNATSNGAEGPQRLLQELSELKSSSC